MTDLRPEARPVITVVTATRDRAHELPGLVDAVLAQRNTPPFELVIVDDGSVDDTRAVLDGIGDVRLRQVHQDGVGPGAARNAGTAVARGEWVVFLDDDDRPDPQ
jgi:glycosyltransferase involved in cell wall biosynthesis